MTPRRLFHPKCEGERVTALAAKDVMQRYLRDRLTLVPCATSNYGRLCGHIDGPAQEMIAHGVAVPYVPYMQHPNWCEQ